MPKQYKHDQSYNLEESLSKSIERFREGVEKQRKIKIAIRAIRRNRREIEQMPEEVQQWFKDAEEYEENEEEEK